MTMETNALIFHAKLETKIQARAQEALARALPHVFLGALTYPKRVHSKHMHSRVQGS